MPYELSCPSCTVKVLSPFVRVGAVVICERCATKYRIAEQQVKRVPLTGVVAKPDDQVVQATNEAESEARITSDGSVAGLSGLSGLMELEPAALSDTAFGVPAPTVNRTPGPPPILAGKHARQEARRRHARVLYALAGLLGLTMGGIGGGLWWSVMGDRHVALPPSRAEDVPVGPQESELIASLPLLTATPMSGPLWERTDAPYRNEPRRGEAYLRDERRAQTEDGHEYYDAQVVANTTDVILSATLRLLLINAENRIVARGAVPVSLFGAGREQRVIVPFPDGLPAGPLRVDAWVDVRDRMGGAFYLGDPDIRPVTPGSKTLLRLRAVNPHDQVLHRTRVVVRALDEYGATISRYEVKIPWPLERRMQLVFRLAIPPPGPEPTPAKWAADVVGSSMP